MGPLVFLLASAFRGSARVSTRSLATDIAILSLFATSLNLLLGTTGLVSFGHAAYFGIGAYTCAILMKTTRRALRARPLSRPVRWLRPLRALFGFFCVRLTKIYFAMLTLAFAQIVWAVCFKWNAVTGGEQGLSNVPYPDLSWMSCDAGPGGCASVGEHFYLLVLVLVAHLLWCCCTGWCARPSAAS